MDFVNVKDGPIIDAKTLPRLEDGHGGIVSCVCTSDAVVENADPTLPENLGCALELACKDGTVLFCETRLLPALFYGFVKGYTEEGATACITDRRVMSVVAKAAAELTPIPVGPVQLPDIYEALEEMITVYWAPTEPLQSRDGIVELWTDEWKKSGKLCKLVDGLWHVASLLPPESEKYKVSHYVNGKEVNYPGAGVTEITLCDGRKKKPEEMEDGDWFLVAVPDEQTTSGQSADPND